MIEVKAEAPVIESHNEPILKATDRCDQRDCGARACFRLTINSFFLYFCLHHFRRYEDKLCEVAEVVLDESAYLTE